MSIRSLEGIIYLFIFREKLREAWYEYSKSTGDRAYFVTSTWTATFPLSGVHTMRTCFHRPTPTAIQSLVNSFEMKDILRSLSWDYTKISVVSWDFLKQVSCPLVPTISAILSGHVCVASWDQQNIVLWSLFRECRITSDRMSKKT